MIRFRKYNKAQRNSATFYACAICAKAYPDGKMVDGRRCPPGNDCCGGYYVEVKDRAKTPKQQDGDRRLLKALLKCVRIVVGRNAAYVVLSDKWATLSLADAKTIKAIANE